jgi:hypothetical protein
VKINLRKLLLDGLLEENFPITPEPKLPQETIEVPSESDGTKDLYESRKIYKQKVNEDNLPVGVDNFKGQVLKNQLDLWYGRKKYGKYDYDDRIVKFIALPTDLKKVEGTDFSLINFVTDAVNNFLLQYNQERPTHPRSKLNNITIKRAYQETENYRGYSNELYVQFFNEVLDPIKYSNKISNFDDFINLFYLWFSEKNTFATKTGFFESSEYNIYNTGLAFDYFTVNSESDINTILNDVRFPVLNYVAKINGLRVDPNYPARLIADIQSEKLINPFVTEYFPADTKASDLPKLVYEKYFQSVNFSESSEQKILEFMSFISEMYNRFIEKYSNISEFNSDSSFKNKFETNKIKRKKALFGDFTVERSDGSSSIKKSSVEYYIKFRAIEKHVKLTKSELKNLTKTVHNIITLYNQKNFQLKTITEKLYISNQAINYLELYLNTRSKTTDGENKKDFKFFIKRAKEKPLTGTEEFASLVEQDEEGNIFSVSPVDISTDFS